jgi:MFS family permease
VTEARPAFYALAPGGWRDYVTLLHPPYTAWHLSYVAIGATLAPQVHWDRLGAAVAAFFLALGVAAHALDELNGRPLATRIPERTLVVLTAISLAGAVAIGIAGAVSFNLWLLVFVAVGVALVHSYTLELKDGTHEPVTAELLYASQESALQLLAAANVALAGALLVLRLA